MTNRERIQDIVAVHIKRTGACSDISRLAESSQITSAGLLMVIADILDEMNEREKARDGDIAKLAACVRDNDGEDDAT